MTATMMKLLDSVKEIPDDLRLWLGERGVLELTLEAVQIMTLRNPSLGTQRFDGFSPQMMLTLLTYGYATDLHSSEDIEWATGSDATVRYICARTHPDWQTIRRFRRANRQWIEQCLVYVLNQAVARRLARTGDHAALAVLRYAETYADAVGWARRKVELAIRMDAAVTQ